MAKLQHKDESQQSKHGGIAAGTVAANPRTLVQVAAAKHRGEHGRDR